MDEFSAPAAAPEVYGQGGGEICPHCGESVALQDVYCPACGETLVDDPEAADQAAETARRQPPIGPLLLRLTVAIASLAAVVVAAAVLLVRWLGPMVMEALRR